MILKAGLYMSWLHAEFTLRLQETQRSLRITKRHPRNQRWRSGPRSAATPQDKYVKHRRLQDVHLRNHMHLQSSALKRDMIFAAMTKTAKMVMNSCKGGVALASTCHYGWKTSKTLNHADFQCQCEFFLRSVMCHLLIKSAKSQFFHTNCPLFVGDSQDPTFFRVKRYRLAQSSTVRRMLLGFF